MTAGLKQLQSDVSALRRRLEDLARRLGALREWTTAGNTPAPESVATGRPGASNVVPSAAAAAVPLFHGLGLGDGALDDVELHFEVLDTEDPGREGR
jgi:hypothetical protein